MAINSYDIVSTLQALGMMKYWKGKHIILKKQVRINTHWFMLITAAETAVARHVSTMAQQQQNFDEDKRKGAKNEHCVHLHVVARVRKQMQLNFM